MGRRSSLTWQGGLDFGECFHILSSYSTPSTFGTQNINTWLSTHVIFTLLFCTLIVTMNSGVDNESTKKKVSNIKQKLALLSSHRLPLRILHNRRLLSSRRLQRLNSRQMQSKNSQGLCRVQLNSFCRRHIRIIRKAYTWISKEQAKSLILLNIPSFWHLCHFSGMNTRKAIDILLSGAYVTRFWMQKPTKEPTYSRFLSLMTLFGNKILFFR